MPSENWNSCTTGDLSDFMCILIGFPFNYIFLYYNVWYRDLIKHKQRISMKSGIRWIMLTFIHIEILLVSPRTLHPKWESIILTISFTAVPNPFFVKYHTLVYAKKQTRQVCNSVSLSILFRKTNSLVQTITG